MRKNQKHRKEERKEKALARQSIHDGLNPQQKFDKAGAKERKKIAERGQ